MSMKKQDRVFNPNDYLPKRFALNYNPPQIIIEYLTPSTGKLYHHKMRLHKFTYDKSTTDVLKQLYDRHGIYLDKKKIKQKQIEKLIEKLKVNHKSNKLASTKDETNTNSQLPPATTTTTPVTKEVENNINKNESTNNNNDDDDDEYGYEDFIDDEEDLNKLDDDELNERKSKMDTYYEKNIIKVGDPNYVYDKRQEFNQDEYAAEWDDDSY